MAVYAVTVGVALARPPAIHEYRRYVVTAESPLTASLLATQWASCTSVMPVYASQPEEIAMAEPPLYIVTSEEYVPALVHQDTGTVHLPDADRPDRPACRPDRRNPHLIARNRYDANNGAECVRCQRKEERG